MDTQTNARARARLGLWSPCGQCRTAYFRNTPPRAVCGVGYYCAGFTDGHEMQRRTGKTASSWHQAVQREPHPRPSMRSAVWADAEIKRHDRKNDLCIGTVVRIYALAAT